MPTSYEIDSSKWPELWQAAYRLLEKSEVGNSLKTWVEPLELVHSSKNPNSTNGMEFHFVAPNDFSAGWVRDHFYKKIQGALEQVTGVPCEIQLSVSNAAGETNASTAPKPNGLSAPTSASPRFSLEEPLAPPSQGDMVRSGIVIKPEKRTISDIETFKQPQAALRLGVDERFTFESYIVGASNQFSHASALSVAENPGRQYNPLFLYASPGLGKTHLLHAIGNYVVSKNPKSRVAYLSAETFVNELIESLKHNDMPAFRTKYRSSFDLLLIDDIQFIAGKKSTEEEFFHTFNALYGSKRQIVVSSDRPPKEIEKLEERIRTRFEWGLVADIQPPEIETRIAILKAKAERDDIYLPDDVATYLAAHIKNNVRELEGVLIRLQARASLTGAEISLEMAKHELKNIIGDEENEITVESIQNVVAKHFSIKVQDLKSSARNKAVALPRQIAMYLSRKYIHLGFKEIGRFFGGKDHTTIMHACTKIEKAFEIDPEIRESVEAIQNRM